MKVQVVIGAVIVAVLSACGSSSPTSNVHVDGTTQAYYNGGTVTLAYTSNFICQSPPTAASTSNCEVGSAATVPPGQPIDSVPPMWVIVPLFTNAGVAPTPQCPMVGMCVDHPSDLDLTTYLSSVFGSGASKYPLPPHSHILNTLDGNTVDPWLVYVVGVLDSTTWSTLTSTSGGASLAELRALQAAENPALGASHPVGTHITVDLPSNLFLNFKVE